MELNYNSETKLHHEKSILEVIKLFFNDKKNIEKLNLKIISELPSQDEFYTKSRIELIEFENSNQLGFELKQEISIADSSIYREVGAIFFPNYNGREFHSWDNAKIFYQRFDYLFQEWVKECKAGKMKSVEQISLILESELIRRKRLGERRSTKKQNSFEVIHLFNEKLRYLKFEIALKK